MKKMFVEIHELEPPVNDSCLFVVKKVAPIPRSIKRELNKGIGFHLPTGYSKILALTNIY